MMQSVLRVFKGGCMEEAVNIDGVNRKGENGGADCTKARI